MTGEDLARVFGPDAKNCAAFLRLCARFDVDAETETYGDAKEKVLASMEIAAAVAEVADET